MLEYVFYLEDPRPPPSLCLLPLQCSLRRLLRLAYSGAFLGAFSPFMLQSIQGSQVLEKQLLWSRVKSRWPWPQEWRGVA